MLEEIFQTDFKFLLRFDWRNERKLNVETFGASANNTWLRRRRGRGGFRRGFRGRGGTNRPVEMQKTGLCLTDLFIYNVTSSLN